MLKPTFSSWLLRWYGRHARSLPWRTRHDPYRVWISEIMLQQTRVETVVPYFKRWMNRFPTIEALAASSERDVLRVWEGLGYYARARNIRRCAQVLVRDFHGQLPSEPRALRSLPGIGDYSAGAIASIAFGRDTATLDGNIRRVLARVFDFAARADSAPGRAQLWRLAESHLPKGHAGTYNQAMMELGATVCHPRQPRCGACPVRTICDARARGTLERRPALRPKKRPPLFLVGAAVVRSKGRVLLARRDPHGLLGGLWEFPNARLSAGSAALGGLRSGWARAVGIAYRLRIRSDGKLGMVRHAYSHFRVVVEIRACTLVSSTSSRRLRWVRLADLRDYPMGKVDREIARRLVSDEN